MAELGQTGDVMKLICGHLPFAIRARMELVSKLARRVTWADADFIDYNHLARSLNRGFRKNKGSGALTSTSGGLLDSASPPTPPDPKALLSRILPHLKQLYADDMPPPEDILLSATRLESLDWYHTNATPILRILSSSQLPLKRIYIVASNLYEALKSTPTALLALKSTLRDAILFQVSTTASPKDTKLVISTLLEHIPTLEVLGLTIPSERSLKKLKEFKALKHLQLACQSQVREKLLNLADLDTTLALHRSTFPPSIGLHTTFFDSHAVTHLLREAATGNHPAIKALLAAGFDPNSAVFTTMLGKTSSQLHFLLEELPDNAKALQGMEELFRLVGGKFHFTSDRFGTRRPVFDHLISRWNTPQHIQRLMLVLIDKPLIEGKTAYQHWLDQGNPPMLDDPTLLVQALQNWPDPVAFSTFVRAIRKRQKVFAPFAPNSLFNGRTLFSYCESIGQLDAVAVSGFDLSKVDATGVSVIDYALEHQTALVSEFLVRAPDASFIKYATVEVWKRITLDRKERLFSRAVALVKDLTLLGELLRIVATLAFNDGVRRGLEIALPLLTSHKTATPVKVVVAEAVLSVDLSSGRGEGKVRRPLAHDIALFAVDRKWRSIDRQHYDNKGLVVSFLKNVKSLVGEAKYRAWVGTKDDRGRTALEALQDLLQDSEKSTLFLDSYSVVKELLVSSKDACTTQ